MAGKGVLDHRIPPPVVGILAAAAMWGIAKQFPPIDFPFRLLLAAGVALAGIAIDVAGLMQFRRSRTTVNPLHPERTSALVTGGIYRRTRNPMYLGMAMLLAAWALYLGSAIALVVLPGFIAYLNRFQIAPEERVLAQRFGADFERYRGEVRRWL